jgi:hypothetical protein
MLTPSLERLGYFRNASPNILAEKSGILLARH